MTVAVAVARPRRHRLLAVGLVLYGLLGLLILAVVLSGVSRGLDRVQALSASFEQQRRSLTSALDTASATLRSTAATVSGIDASLSQAQTAVTDAASLANDVSATMSQLGGALNVNILGSQPFVGVSGGFTQASTELQTLATELGRTSEALGRNSTDSQAVGRDLVRLQTAVQAVRDGLKGAPNTAITADDLGSLRLVLTGLLAWLAVQAAAAVLLGAWLWRRAGRRDPPAL